jgi:hypothetical protein
MVDIAGNIFASLIQFLFHAQRVGAHRYMRVGGSACTHV